MKRSIYTIYISALLAVAAHKTAATEHPQSGVGAPARRESENAPSQSSPTVNIADLVIETLARNPELSFYRAEIAAAKADQRTAGTRPNPDAEFELGRKRSRSREGSMSDEGMAWGVAVSQTFDWPNRLALRKAIASRQVELAELGLAQFQRDLANEVQVAAFKLLIAQEKRDAALNVAQRGEELVAALLQREPAGTSPLIESRIIQANVLTLKRRAVEAAAETQSALLDLNQLRGAPIETPLRVEPVKLRFPNLKDADSFIALAGTNSFDIKSRVVELEQQGLRVELARNERFPAFAVRPFFSQEEASEREQVAGVGVSVPLPLWNRNKGNIDAAKSREEQAQGALTVAQRNIETQLRKSLARYELNRGEIERWRTDLVDQLEEAADLADRHYRLGSVPVATYVEMQDKYLEALDTVLDTQAEALSALQTIERLTGVPLGNVTNSHQRTGK